MGERSWAGCQEAPCLEACWGVWGRGVLGLCVCSFGVWGCAYVAVVPGAVVFGAVVFGAVRVAGVSGAEVPGAVCLIFRVVEFGTVHVQLWCLGLCDCSCGAWGRLCVAVVSGDVHMWLWYLGLWYLGLCNCGILGLWCLGLCVCSCGIWGCGV